MAKYQATLRIDGDDLVRVDQLVEQLKALPYARDLAGAEIGRGTVLRMAVARGLAALLAEGISSEPKPPKPPRFRINEIETDPLQYEIVDAQHLKYQFPDGSHATTDLAAAVGICNALNEPGMRTYLDSVVTPGPIEGVPSGDDDLGGHSRGEH